jgi:RNA polymerase sigma-70 factor (ECF subfamily)
VKVLSEHSDEKNIKLLCKGNAQAFNSLYEKYHTHLYYFALKFLKAGELAEEAVHDVFLKIWENRKNLRPDLNFKAYLFTICKNHIVNMLLRATKEREIKNKIALHLATSHNELEETVVYADYMHLAYEAIHHLPPQRQLVFKLCREEGKTYAEIAETLNISTGTVRDHIVKAGKFIKSYLAAHAQITISLLIALSTTL